MSDDNSHPLKDALSGAWKKIAGNDDAPKTHSLDDRLKAVSKALKKAHSADEKPAAIVDQKLAAPPVPDNTFKDIFSNAVQSPLSEKVASQISNGKLLSLQWTLKKIDQKPDQLPAVADSVGETTLALLNAGKFKEYLKTSTVLDNYSEKAIPDEESFSYSILHMGTDPSPKRQRQWQTAKTTRETISRAADRSVYEWAREKMNSHQFTDVVDALDVFSRGDLRLMRPLMDERRAIIDTKGATALTKSLFEGKQFGTLSKFVKIIADLPDELQNKLILTALRPEISRQAADMIKDKRTGDFKELVEIIKPYPVLRDAVQNALETSAALSSGPKP